MTKEKLSKKEIRQKIKEQKEADHFHFGFDPSLKKESDNDKMIKFIDEQSTGDSRKSLDKRMKECDEEEEITQTWIS